MARILVVDDHDDLRAMMKERLENEQHTVETRANGREGMECLQSETFDLVILDWELPEMHGIDILKKFRMHGGNTPVLMLTGRKMMEDKEAGFDAGADDYLTKPFHPKEFSARVKALLKRSAPLGRAAELEAGSIIADKYQVTSILGEGGVGVVYKATHKFLNKPVALKVLRPDFASDHTVVARFRQEAQAADSLRHPNIATVFDYGIMPDGRPFMVMDYLEGQTLYNLLRQVDRVDIQRAVPIFMQVCDALTVAHDHAIIHRDLKPSNIMLVQEDGKETVKLLDFGIAKLLDSAHMQQLTRTGEFCGSPLYASPEQCGGQTQDARADIFSLGCVICETITGHAPFHGQSVIDTIHKRLHEDPPTVEHLCPGVPFPAMLNSIIHKALALNPSKRYQTAQELKQDLASLI